MMKSVGIYVKVVSNILEALVVDGFQTTDPHSISEGEL